MLCRIDEKVYYYFNPFISYGEINYDLYNDDGKLEIKSVYSI